MGAYPDRAGAFSFVPRLPGWSFPATYLRGTLGPLRIPFDRLRAAVSPIDKWRKDSAIPPVTSEKNPTLSIRNVASQIDSLGHADSFERYPRWVFDKAVQTDYK